MLFVKCMLLLLIVAGEIDANSGSLREYSLRKDYFNGIKVAEFTVTDISKKTVYYRIESKFSFMPKFELIDYSSKQVVGNLDSKVGSITLSLLDSKTGQRLTGSMKAHLTLTKGLRYTIELAGRQIKMESNLFSTLTTFRDESQDGAILARFQRESFSPITATTYGLQVYSNDIPDGLYMLALAWTDIGRSESYTNGMLKWKN
ncbi:hypothetical protein I4U23_015192 [Adineta vaga]|nr:hypothetical protein I4U23_015192 [Adineta vaga]